MATATALSDGATKRAMAVTVVVALGLVAIGVAAGAVGWDALDDDGERTAAGWALVAAGVVAVVLGIGRTVVAVRVAWTLRGRPWHPGTLAAVYPKRRRLAVQLDPEPEEHLIQVSRGSGRKLGRLGRKSPVVAVGRGRTYVVAPAEGRRYLVLGRMDVPLDRLHLINPGAAPDRFDDRTVSPEVF